MTSVSELRLLTPGPAGLAEPSRRSGSAAIEISNPSTPAPEQIERPTAQKQAPELTRSQAAQQRLNKNRAEHDPSQNGMLAPEREASFGDFLDLINPLHHIPIVGTIYRAITGDEIDGAAKILGGLLFGGPIGFIASIVATIVEEATGRDLGETVLAAFIDQDEPPTSQVAATQDRGSISLQDHAARDGPPAATGTAGSVSGRGDPFGLERWPAAPIAATPASLMPAANAAAPERSAAPGTWPVGQIARPPAEAAPNPPATTGFGVGQGEPLLVTIVPGPDAFSVPVTTDAPFAAVEVISTDASRPGNQRLTPSIATTDRGFAERMLEALDKYQAQASERYQGSPGGIRRIDLNL